MKKGILTMDIQSLTSPVLLGMCVGGLVFLIMMKFVKAVVSRIVTAIAAAILASYFGIHFF